MEDQVLFTINRAKAAGLLWGSVLAFVVSLCIYSPGNWKGLAVTALFGVGILLGCIMSSPNAIYLRLDSSGFSQVNPFCSYSFKWPDVAACQKTLLGRSRALVVRIKPDVLPVGTLARLKAGLSGDRFYISDTYSTSLDAIDEAFLKFLSRYGNIRMDV